MGLLSSVSKFFTVKEQAARLKNVGAVLTSAFTGKGVTANVKNPTVKKVLETVASHPYAAAAVGTAGTMVAKRIIPKVTTAIAAKKAAAQKPGMLGKTADKVNYTKPVSAPESASAQAAVIAKKDQNDISIIEQTAKPQTMLGGALSAIIGNKPIAKTIGSTTATKKRKSSVRRKKIKHAKRKKAKKSTRKAARRSAKRSRRHGKKSKRVGLHYTKKGQPYKILASGKAKFVKKKHLKRRKARK
jgi:colicin import membrane protein